VKPTDTQMHIGNYFGAIKPMMQLAEKFADAEIFLFLANMHAYTYLHDGVALKQNSYNVLKLYAACGVDLERFVIYNHAELPAHAQLNRVLECFTHM
jgi:tryptophanyl-tRNA synthetase